MGRGFLAFVHGNTLQPSASNVRRRARADRAPGVAVVAEASVTTSGFSR
jgi:hypothetical protein